MLALGTLHLPNEDVFALPGEMPARVLQEVMRARQLLPGDEETAHRMTRTFAKAISDAHGIAVIPVYKSFAARDLDYKQGDIAALVATVSNLGVVDEDRLTWEQVVEVRRDKEACHDLRRLTHWLDATLVGKSYGFVEDAIAVRLHRYEKTIKKHGIRTVLGSVAATLDSRFLTGGAAAVAAAAYVKDPATAALVGGAIIIGKVAVHVAQSLLDLDDVKAGEGSEVAFVAELKKL